ncbi:hypothetical protein [Marinoscillum sp.]|uniref:hypothetical protein n=1 Tax=Marinoscillum sp. TaxID=2024838 RepID=UPI003BAB2BBF
MNLLILKSNIRTRKKERLVARVLDHHPSIERWTVDREDVDHVLRIEYHSVLTDADIDALLRPFGLYCKGLPE